MALSNDRTGHIHGPITLQQDFDLRADSEVFLGGLYRVVDGMLTIPDAAAAQDHCITVMALQHRSNAGGLNRAKRARCIVIGVALMPAGTLAPTNIGKPVYPTSDDAVGSTAPSTLPGNQPAGILLAIDRSIASIKLG